jgi:hypothetical protein
MALALRENAPWAQTTPRYHPTMQNHIMPGDMPLGRNQQRRTIDYAGTVIRMVQVRTGPGVVPTSVVTCVAYVRSVSTRPPGGASGDGPRRWAATDRRRWLCAACAAAAAVLRIDACTYGRRDHTTFL